MLVLVSPYLNFSMFRIFKKRPELLTGGKAELGTAVQQGTGGIKVTVK